MADSAPQIDNEDEAVANYNPKQNRTSTPITRGRRLRNRWNTSLASICHCNL